MKKTYQQQEDRVTSVHEPAMAYGYGSFDDAGIFGLMDAVKRGVSFKAFEGISKKFPFNMQNWADFLHVSGKTLSRYQKEDKTFDAPQTERILQIEMLYSRGVEVFGSEDYFMKWLQSESLVLGKKKPQEFLDSSFGITLLMDELTRIEHGILA